MTFMWSRSLTEDLINSLQEHECLWDVKNPDYSDRMKRYEALNNIYLELRERNSKVTTKNIRDKIQILRTQFRREVRAVDGPGVPEDMKRNPKLWCYDMLWFLRPNIGRNSNIMYLKNDDVDELKMETQSDDYEPMVDPFGNTSPTPEPKPANQNNNKKLDLTELSPNVDESEEIQAREKHDCAEKEIKKHKNKKLDLTEIQANFYENEEIRAKQKHEWEKKEAELRLQILETDLKIKQAQLEEIQNQ